MAVSKLCDCGVLKMFETWGVAVHLPNVEAVSSRGGFMVRHFAMILSVGQGAETNTRSTQIPHEANSARMRTATSQRSCAPCNVVRTLRDEQRMRRCASTKRDAEPEGHHDVQQVLVTSVDYCAGANVNRKKFQHTFHVR